MSSRNKLDDLLSSDDVRPLDQQKNNSNVPLSGLDAYNFAIDKMHMICGKYPLKSEAYLRNTQVPDLNDYLAWKNVSNAALVRKYTVFEAVQAYHQEYRTLSGANTNVECLSSTGLDSLSTTNQNSPEVDAARILTTMNFHALVESSTVQAYDATTSFNDTDPGELLSPKFPRPDDLPMPDGEDAFLLNPVLEDTLGRWVQGNRKEDRKVEVWVEDGNGYQFKAYKTIYMVDGHEFHNQIPQHRNRRRTTRNKRPVKLVHSSSGGLQHTSVPMAPQVPRSRKRPLDSGIAMDDDFERPRQKRIRSDSSSDMPLSSISRPGLGLLRQSNADGRKISSGSNNSSDSQVSTKDFANLRDILNKKAIGTVVGTITSTGQEIMGAPPLDQAHAPTGQIATSSTPGRRSSTRRRGPPAPLNLAPPARSSRQRITPDPCPATPSITPQHSSVASATATPRKNKYVPTTPNPLRWTARELYHLNDLARQGLHPKELHPRMMAAFPDKQRSIHAIKDRRDKMARGKELQGKVPDYQGKYGDV